MVYPKSKKFQIQNRIPNSKVIFKMADERGRWFQKRLDTESSKYTTLVSIFKKIIKAEEDAKKTKEAFSQKWLDISKQERSPGIKNMFYQYSVAIQKIEKSHTISIDRLKTVILDSLQNYPIKIKDQKRNLSKRNKSKSRADKTTQQVNKGKETLEKQKYDELANKGTIQQRLAQEGDIKMDENMGDYELARIHDMKNMMLNLLNSEMHYHSSALQHLADVFTIVIAVDVNQELQNLQVPT